MAYFTISGCLNLPKTLLRSGLRFSTRDGGAICIADGPGGGQTLPSAVLAYLSYSVSVRVTAFELVGDERIKAEMWSFLEN